MNLDIDYILNLARLDLTNSEKEKFSKQLSDILEYMKKLQTINTDNIILTSHPITNIKQHLREDKIKVFEDRDNLISISPDKQSNYFKIPKVI